MDLKALLKRYFGYDSFRPVQEEIARAILHGDDVVAIMPTGAGKSICFQIPALALPHGTVVISPLISLMKDQVEALSAQGIPAAFVNSTVAPEETVERLRDLYRGRLKLLYMAPEKLEQGYFTDCLRQVPLSLVVIDEAHCVSQWGHDFRPSYRKIDEFIKKLPVRPVVAAFTATATPLVERDMRENLDLLRARLFRTGLDRPNLSFRVMRGVDKEDFIREYIEAHPKEAGIIYCATRKAVEETYEFLHGLGIAVGRYHAGMADEERRRAQEDFSFDRTMVMVATNAFGMGIDKSNVRYVIHHAMPKSPEAYYQEAGRAGRDGSAADCILLYSARDVRTQEYLIGQNESDEEKADLDYERLRRMEDYCRTSGCLRNFLLDYFGEKAEATCGHCGNCEAAAVGSCVTDEATLIFRTADAIGGRFGAGIIAEILKGARTEKVISRHFEELPTYGKLAHETAKGIREAIARYVADGYLLREGGQYPTIAVTEKGKAVIAGNADVYGISIGGQKAVAHAATRKKSRTKEKRSPLFETLRVLRLQIAEEEGVPPFVVFTDAALEDMAQKQPKTMEEMANVHGVGAFKLRKYGARFLKALGYEGEPSPLPNPTEGRTVPARGAQKLPQVHEKEMAEEETFDEAAFLTYMDTVRTRLAKKAGVAPDALCSEDMLLALLRDKNAVKEMAPEYRILYGPTLVQAAEVYRSIL